MIEQETLNDLSQEEWKDETEEDRIQFDLKNKQIDELYPKDSPSDKGNAGEHAVALRIDTPSIIGWTYRKQGGTDYGIDAYFEIKKNNRPTGRLVAAQIKYGPSYVTDKGDYFVFYGKYKHLLYWLNFSLPVVIVYVEDNENEESIPTCYWVEVKREKIKTLENSWKIKIPKNQLLKKECIPELEKVAPPRSISDLRFIALKLQLPYMEHLYNGGKMALEFTDQEKETDIYLVEEDQHGTPLRRTHWKNVFPIEQFFNKKNDGFPLPWAINHPDIPIGTGKQKALTKADWKEVRETTHSKADIVPGTNTKIYFELSPFGLEFLNITWYLSTGEFNFKNGSSD